MLKLVQFGLTLAFVMVAQVMIANWLRNGGGIGNDEAFDMDTDGNGNYFTTGYFSGTAEFGTLSVTSSGPGDVFVMRSSEQGQVTWVKKFGGPGSDRANAIATDPSGNSYITGVFSQTAQFGAFTLTSSSDVLDVFIAKIDASGNVLWAVSCGGVYDDYAYGIDVDPSGNVLVTGKFMGTAQIGAASFTSAWNTELDVYSYDIFFAKLDPLGNWLWAKQGSAEDDDRGLDITSDLVGNVYVTGQFSDTLSMDGEHPNEVENAGFLARYSSEGLFEWIVLFSATQTQCYDIQCDPGGDVLACGEYIGQMLIVGPDNYFVPYSHPYNIFLMRFDDEGQLVWASQEGSENAVSAKALCIGQEGEVYVTGTFSCVFTEFSDELGSGLFNSVGFRDVFIIRYSESGERIWNRQYGGSRDDYCSGIASGSLTDTPIIAGSFSDLFNVPENVNFELYPDNYVYVPCQEYIAGWQDCYDESYQDFIQVLSSGNKDVFFTRPYASDAHHYDYYIRSTLIGCSFDALEPCISYHLSPICYDTLHFCDHGLLKGITNTLCSYSPGLAPLYIFEWEDGSVEPDTLIYQSGTYGLEIRREDYCESWTKEVEVIVSVSPPFPLLSDDIIVNEEELPWDVTNLSMCLDSVWLFGTTSCTQCTIEWFGPGYFAEGVDSVEAWDGLYTFRVTDTTGCSTINDIFVNQIEQVEVDTILQDFQILYQGQVVSGDSIEICAGDDIVLMYLDNGVPMYFGPFDISYEFEIEGWAYEEPQEAYGMYFEPPGSGNYIFTGQLVAGVNNACQQLAIPYPELIQSVFVTVNPEPFVTTQIDGPSLMCAGDTLLLVGSGSDNLVWSGQGILQVLSPDSVLVVAPGGYFLSGTETNEYGCTDNDSDFHLINYFEAPVVTMMPASGLVCPGDSVLLTCQSGINYQWIGPLGLLPDTTQSIYVTVPGFYFCVQTNTSGCTLESNQVEVKEYNSPYLIAYPGTDLCVAGEVTVQVITNDDSLIDWLPPVEGDSPTLVIDSAGTYVCQVTLCEITNDLEIVIEEGGTPTSIYSDAQVICEGDSLMLLATPGMASYEWLPGDSNADSLVVYEPGIYSVVALDAGGCYNASSPFTVYSVDEVQPQVVGDSLCAGSSTLLTADCPIPVFWSFGETGNPVESESDSFNTGAIWQVTLVYVFVQNSPQCYLPSVAQLSIYPGSVTPEIFGPLDYCVGDNLIVYTEPTPGVDYAWTLPDGATFAGDTLMIGSIELSESGTYSLTASDAFCTSVPDSAVVVIHIPTDFDVELISPDSICVNEGIHIITMEEAPQFMWQTPAGNFIGGNEWEVLSASVADQGWYSAITEETICTNMSDSVYVYVGEFPDATLDDQVFCDGGVLMAAAPETADYYLWSTGNTTAEVSIYSAGWLWIQLTDLPHCTSRDSIWIEATGCLDDFPNIFTPNGDGYNDGLDFQNLLIPIEKVVIYNRWGNEIRILQGDYPVWDGRDASLRECSEGVYYYIIYAAGELVFTHQKSGYVHLIRKE